MLLLQRKELPSARDALSGVVIQHEGGIIHQASADINYATGDFARDQEAVALDLIPYNAEIARLTIISLAQNQATTYDSSNTYPVTEKAPGRIHHEKRSTTEPEYLRTLFASDKDYETFVAVCQKRSADLIAQWGEIYYGAVDSTPKYLLLAKAYLEATHDTSLLETTYSGTDGKEHTIKESLLLAGEWVYNNVMYGPHVLPDEQTIPQQKRLLRFQRQNDCGIENQVMMDSAESFVYPNGTRADHSQPIADTGVQGQAYDALLFAADLLEDRLETTVQKASLWKQAASDIQTNTLALWMDTVSYFAMGEDSHGPIPTLCANVVELLSSTLLDNIPEDAKQKYISGIVRMVFSHEFLTEVGIRTRALQHANIYTVTREGHSVRFSDYHGSDSVWMEKLRWLIRGLSEQGFHTLADQMRMALVDSINIEGTHTEFFWVTPEGKPIYNHKSHQKSPGDLNVTSLSENEQAWTISAVLATKRELGQRDHPTTQPGSWQETVEAEIITSMRERGVYRESPMKTRRAVLMARQERATQTELTIDPIMGSEIHTILLRRFREGSTN